MIKTAIVLAGGLGTRLQHVVKDLPKPMADINGRPFLFYLLQYLSSHHIEKVILSVGYKAEIIEDYFGGSFHGLQLHYSVELEPLGTGGAIVQAIGSSDEDEFFIFNGDTFFNVPLEKFWKQHVESDSRFSIALKPMKNFDRYGVVTLDPSGKVISFHEKSNYGEGIINGGIYLIHRKAFDKFQLPGKFSFEKDLMELHYNAIAVYGFVFDEYFIDIGIPEDYERAKREFARMGN